MPFAMRTSIRAVVIAPPAIATELACAMTTLHRTGRKHLARTGRRFGCFGHGPHPQTKRHGSKRANPQQTPGGVCRTADLEKDFGFSRGVRPLKKDGVRAVLWFTWTAYDDGRRAPLAT